MANYTTASPIKNKQRDSIDYNGILSARGVLTACKIAGWEYRDGRWHYPIWDMQGNEIGTRSKRADNSNAPKYLWHPSKPNHELASWYIPPNAMSAIKANGGTCYLANGEISVLAMHSAGVFNCISTTETENKVPDNAIEVLQKLGVTSLHNVFDNDKAGRDGASKWKHALKDSGIIYNARQWDSDKSGYDANDLWIECGFSAGHFVKALLATKVVILRDKPKPVKKHVLAANSYVVGDTLDYEQELEKTRYHIASLLGIPHDGFKRDGFSRKNVSSPFRSDDNPSFSYNINSGAGNDFGGDSYNLQELCNHFNVAYPERKKRSVPKKPIDLDAIPTDDKPQPTNDTDNKQSAFAIERDNQGDIVYPEGVPTEQDHYNDTIRAQVKMYRDGVYQSWVETDELPMSLYSAVLVLSSARSAVPVMLGKMHKAFMRGCLNWAAFTIGDVADCTGIKRQTVSSALQQLETWGFITYVQNLYPISIDSIMGTHSGQKSGRTPTLYAINPDYSVIVQNILSMLKIYYTEKHFTENIAQRTEAMAALAGIYDMDTFTQWHNRVKTVKYEANNRQAEAALNKEFTGDGHGWVGWYKALQATGTPKVDWDAIDTTKDLRAAILRWWVIDYKRDVNSVEQLERLLGCSATTVKSARIAANLRSIERKVTVEYWRDKDGKKRIVARTSDYELKAELENKLQPPTTWNYNDLLYYTCKRVLGAPMRSWIKIKDRYATDADGNHKFTKDGSLILESLPVTPDAPEGWAMNANIVMFSYQISLPSRYVAMTDDEIADEIADEQQAEQSEDSDNEATESAPKAKRNAPQATKDAHNWHEHTTNWIYQQLRLEVAHFTDYELKHRAIYKDGERVQSFKTLREIVVWLNNADSRGTR